MYTYAFVKIPLLSQREGLQPARDYREVVRARAEAGWQFVQLISFDHHPEPHLDLVFTRKESAQ